MTAIQFATYFHPHVAATSRPLAEIAFTGYSLPYFDRVRAVLAATTTYPTIALASADFWSYEAVHTTAYLDALTQMARGEIPAIRPRLSGECNGLEFCLPGYQASLGGLCAAIDQMHAGNLERAYCLSLGGHHAFPNWGHGYCLLNPLAAAIRYAQQEGFARIVMIDWDIHHGDGTQTIFANDASVYCISIHSAFDLYMATMHGLGAGTTTAARALGHCNIPVLNRRFPADMPARLGLDGRFYTGTDSIPALADAINDLPWQPDLICIFAGYDAHKDDCGRGITDWQTQDYDHLTRIVLDAAASARCPVLSVHGGGYRFDVTIEAAQQHMQTLSTYRSPAN